MVTEASHNSLNEVLERLDALSGSRGSTRDDILILDLGEPSAATGPDARGTRTLLRGGRLRDREVGKTAPRRVKFPYERRPKGSGGRPADYFGVPVAFFTDTAADAPARELRPVVAGLGEPDPLVSLTERVGIEGVRTRTDNTHLTPEAKTRIAVIVRPALGQEQGEKP